MKDKDTSPVPLILRQRPRTTGSTNKALPYQPPAETYDLFRNQKSPFLGRLITAPTEPRSLQAEQLKALFEKMQEPDASYRLAYPSAVGVHHKRRVAPNTASAGKTPQYGQKNTASREAPERLQHFLRLFMDQVLLELREQPYSLPRLINLLVPLFEEMQIRLRIYDAYRQFQSFDQLLETLTLISEDTEIENFELFCSALFGFYSQIRQ